MQHSTNFVALSSPGSVLSLSENFITFVADLS